MAVARNPDDHERVLTFDVDETTYCVDVERVASVLAVDPDGIDDASDPWFAGEISIVGERVRIVDLARVFDSPIASPARGDDPIVVVFETTDPDGRHYGWLVDAVDGATRVPTANLERPRGRSGFVAGRIERADETLVWLDERAINE